MQTTAILAHPDPDPLERRPRLIVALQTCRSSCSVPTAGSSRIGRQAEADDLLQSLMDCRPWCWASWSPPTWSGLGGGGAGGPPGLNNTFENRRQAFILEMVASRSPQRGEPQLGPRQRRPAVGRGRRLLIGALGMDLLPPQRAELRGGGVQLATMDRSKLQPSVPSGVPGQLRAGSLRRPQPDLGVPC